MAANPLRILSIDGGGTRGIIPATILQCIHESTGRHPVELFDLFAGTSTGSIVCACLLHGLNPEWVVQLYLERSDARAGDRQRNGPRGYNCTWSGPMMYLTTVGGTICATASASTRGPITPTIP